MFQIHVETKFVPKDLEKSVEASTKDMVYAVKAWCVQIAIDAKAAAFEPLNVLMTRNAYGLHHLTNCKQTADIVDKWSFLQKRYERNFLCRNVSYLLCLII